MCKLTLCASNEFWKEADVRRLSFMCVYESKWTCRPFRYFSEIPGMLGNILGYQPTVARFQQAPDESRDWDETSRASQVGPSLSFAPRTRVWSPDVHVTGSFPTFPYGRKSQNHLDISRNMLICVHASSCALNICLACTDMCKMYLCMSHACMFWQMWCVPWKNIAQSTNINALSAT